MYKNNSIQNCWILYILLYYHSNYNLVVVEFSGYNNANIYKV